MYSFIVIFFLTALVLFSATIFRNIGLAMIFNVDALMIVGGGTIIALFLGFSIRRLKKTFADVLDSFHPMKDRQELAKEMLDLARTSRKADIRGLERKIRAIKDEFLRLGMNLLISHRTSRDIRTVMEREMTTRITDYHFNQNVLKTIARLTPSLGLAGTVISLIKIFKISQSIDDVVPLMAVAMMSTFYGVIISNLFFLPICAKLEERTIQSEEIMQGIIEGVISMNEWQNPLYVEERISGNYEGNVLGRTKMNVDLVLSRAEQTVHSA